MATRETSNRPKIPIPPRFPRIYLLLPRFPRRAIPGILLKRLLPSGRKRVVCHMLVAGLVYLGLFVTLYRKFSSLGH